MAKTPARREGLIHTPADGDNFPSEVASLQSVVNSQETGPVQSNGLRLAVRGPVVLTAISEFQWAIFRVRDYGQDYPGAGIVPRGNENDS